MKHLILIALSIAAFGQSLSAQTQYLDTYEESRAEFRRLSEETSLKFKKVEKKQISVPSNRAEDLTIDTLYIPAQESPKGLVVVVSGVHGAEAFAAATVQRQILREQLLDNSESVARLKNTGYLFVHSVNPYGFKYGRRVTENNVDLNRNFSSNDTIFKIQNPGYGRLEMTLNPKSQASNSLFSDLKVLFGIGKELTRTKKSEVLQAISGGQYEYSKGIFFGGNTFEPQVSLLEALLLKTAQPYTKVLILDVHTGYGKKGFMHLLPNPPDTVEIASRWKKVFGNYPIEETGGDFYSSEGDFSTFASRILEKVGKATVPMLIEFGTADSQTTVGSLKSLTRVIAENQLHHHGANSESDHKGIKSNYRELFFPSDPKWREVVLKQVQEHMPEFIKAFERL